MKRGLIIISFLIFSESLCTQNHTGNQFKTTPVFNSEIIQRDTVLKTSFLIAKNLKIKSHCIFQNAEFIFTENVELILDSGATLEIIGSHLYSQGSKMWKGIRLSNGTKLITKVSKKNSVLIEDAETAISVNNYTTSTVNPILNISKTIFNKNYVDVNINYLPVIVANDTRFAFNDCIFTCRDFSFTSSTWPSVSTSSPGLRYFTTNTTVPLASPYLLQGASIINLKSPYSTKKSHMAIQLTDIGLTYTGTSTYTFCGLDLSPNYGGFNLFDAHENFVSVLRGNLTLTNSVFQNTQTFSVSGTPTVGAAIQHSTNTVYNYQLNMSAANSTVGNKFFDCHNGILGTSIYDFGLENATFRSTQSSTALTNGTFQATGQQGVFINTNQADNYLINHNEFTNTRSGVTINFVPAPTIYPGLPSGWSVYPYTTYIRKVAIHSNTFSPELSTTYTYTTNHYVKNAVVLTSPHIHYMYTACACNSLSINDNVIYSAFNGIKLEGINSFTMSCRNSGINKAIMGNTITLAEDFVAHQQKAIEYTYNQSYPTLWNQIVQRIEKNKLSVRGGTLAISNTSITLMYLNENGGITSSSSGTTFPAPHILCNELSNAYQGFVFDGANKPASWRGNKMEALQIAMTLSNTGIIGQQGDAANSSDNEWNVPAWWTGSNYGTWVDLGSTATNSKLYHQSSSSFPPLNNGGFASAQNRYSWPSIPTNTIIVSGGFAAYSCSATGNYTIMNSTLPNPVNYPSSELLYIANTFAYRFLAINDSLETSDVGLQNFYDSLSGSSIDLFTQIEKKINIGAFSDAAGLLSGLSTGTFNAVENNYYNFYLLYNKYLEGASPLDATDIEALISLAGLCPGTNGSAVYQARSLFQLVLGEVWNGSDGCGSSARPGVSLPPQGEIKLAWDVDLFPNPNNGNFALISKNEKEILEVIINDISGREVYKKQVETKKFVYVLELPLSNGAYFIKIKNQSNETVTKKMVITK